MAPKFEVDPMCEAAAQSWVMGATVGVSVDAQSHIWIIHRPNALEDTEVHAAKNPPWAKCCTPAPPVLEFDQAGNLVGHWGGPGAGYDWPERNHGITVDYKGNVWIGGADQLTPPHDDMLLKFTHEGKFLMQIGKPLQSKGSDDTQNLRLPAKTFIDPKRMKSTWPMLRQPSRDCVRRGYRQVQTALGAYGHKPDDTIVPYKPSDPPPQQFSQPGCTA